MYGNYEYKNKIRECLLIVSNKEINSYKKQNKAFQINSELIVDITKRYEKDLIIVLDNNITNLYTDSQSSLFKRQSKERESINNSSKNLGKSKDICKDNSEKKDNDGSKKVDIKTKSKY